MKLLAVPTIIQLPYCYITATHNDELVLLFITHSTTIHPDFVNLTLAHLTILCNKMEEVGSSQRLPLHLSLALQAAVVNGLTLGSSDVAKGGG